MKIAMPANIPASAPTSALRIVLETIGAYSAVYQAARERISDRRCPDLNALAERDETDWKARMADHEILRHRVECMNLYARPNYAPVDRFAILQFMRLAGFSHPLEPSAFSRRTWAATSGSIVPIDQQSIFRNAPELESWPS